MCGPHLTPKELAKRWHKNIETLANWRHKGIGPAFLKLGKQVLYPLEAVEAYEAQQLRNADARED